MPAAYLSRFFCKTEFNGGVGKDHHGYYGILETLCCPKTFLTLLKAMAFSLMNESLSCSCAATINESKKGSFYAALSTVVNFLRRNNEN